MHHWRAAGWLPNPLLPDTAAELAVPLLAGDKLIGVLDVQADRVNAFSEEDASIQSILASQIAIAIQIKIIGSFIIVLFLCCW